MKTITLDFDIDDKVFFIENRKVQDGIVRDFILFGSKKEIILKYVVFYHKDKTSVRIEIDQSDAFKSKAELKKQL